uniref:Uncharacterized protein n=1 Tax=viral metagenome TaxID=1070528 RepID=A0A6M3J8H5_9ZZZZ
MPETQDFGGLNPDELRSALSFATNIGEQRLAAMNPQPEEAPVEAPEMPTQAPVEAQNAPASNELDEGKIKSLVEDKVKEIVKEEMSGLKKQLEEALNDEEEEDTEGS